MCCLNSLEDMHSKFYIPFPQRIISKCGQSSIFPSHLCRIVGNVKRYEDTPENREIFIIIWKPQRFDPTNLMLVQNIKSEVKDTAKVE